MAQRIVVAPEWRIKCLFDPLKQDLCVAANGTVQTHLMYPKNVWASKH
jgi:hypothetical protein